MTLRDFVLAVKQKLGALTDEELDDVKDTHARLATEGAVFVCVSRLQAKRAAKATEQTR